MKVMEHENIDWSKSHNGVMLCSFDETVKLMPEVKPILLELISSGRLELHPSEYSVDVKIHMLMPNQFPCIPNWHRDFIPRGEDNKRNPHGITGEKMYEWISGTPLTEFKIKENGEDYFVEPNHWHEFTQEDVRRGTMSTKHQWRCFIRVIPTKFIHPTTINVGMLRRHTQVYLDSNKFNW